MDFVVQDKGILGLCKLVNSWVVIDVENTDWSQWT